MVSPQIMAESKKFFDKILIFNHTVKAPNLDIDS